MGQLNWTLLPESWLLWVKIVHPHAAVTRSPDGMTCPPQDMPDRAPCVFRTCGMIIGGWDDWDDWDGVSQASVIYPINQVSHEIGVSQSWGTNHHNIRPKMTGLLANWVLMKKTLKTSWKGRQVAGACRKCRVLSGAVETWWSCCPDWCRIYRLDDVGLWNRRFHRKTAKKPYICWLMVFFHGILNDGHHLQLAIHRIFNQRLMTLTGRGNRLRWRMWRRGSTELKKLQLNGWFNGEKSSSWDTHFF